MQSDVEGGFFAYWGISLFCKKFIKIVVENRNELENGTRNPSINLLKRLAEGMDMVLKIEFVPKQKV